MRRAQLSFGDARIFRGDTRSEGKILSLFEPSTEIIRKGKAGKPNCGDTAAHRPQARGCRVAAAEGDQQISSQRSK
ncbi:hypothetical protein NLM33_37660 [Bradyrhizobium sp. CCGUVB1N3]|uniref:hypothetical protein n=1 Tax=Bradyrhizobium sp. CCGUVB1N3 TaxID=2949629 RepID=UPI0020B3B639|nr:hypothetical protein [Bradyrhizobium sp. CCGUVB1N3]MCP3475966.1 hypothetical protein [Bradyrhizobium sp. CCGUVB1N3]